MNKIFYKSIFTLLSVLCIGLNASAAPAKRGLMTFRQPDGTTFLATLRGDEFQHILVTQSGQAVVQGEDKYYYYATFDAAGGRHSSGVRVGSMDAPSKVLSESAAIPYETIREIAADKKRARPVEEMNLIQRLNAKRGPLTKSDDAAVTKHGIVILVDYQDVKMQYTNENFTNMLKQTGYSYNGAAGCAKEYFDAQFGGLYEFDFEVYGPYTVSQNQSYYGGNDSSGSDKDPEDMIIEACQLADNDVDFSIYDDDMDGEIDNVFVFYAGGDEAEGDDEDCIWPHAWYIYDGAGKTVMLDGVKLNRYACSAELTTPDSGKTHKMAPIGTFCHEYVHTFGLGDLYDTDYDGSGGTSDALWLSTALTDGGNYNNNGNTPPNLNALERYELGLGVFEDLPTGTVKLEAISSSNTYYKLESGNTGEYYLFECRSNTGWDKYAGGSGLLVYHIDKSKNSAGKSDTYRTTLTAKERWEYNEINARPSHQCADIVEANPNAQFVSQIYFPNSTYTSITPTGKNSIKFWDGTIADISISGISYSNGVVTMTISGGVVSVPEVVLKDKAQYQDEAIVNFESSFAYDDEATVEYGASGKTATTITVKPYSSGKYAAVLTGLTPSTSYNVTIYFKKDDIVSPSVKTSVMTASYSSQGLPYIYLKNITKNEDGTFPTGTQLPLVIYNKRSDVDGVVWYLNASSIKVGGNGYYELTKSGTLRAEIIYSDGSTDVISKNMIVK